MNILLRQVGSWGKSRLAWTALAVRLFVWIAMIISYSLLPDHNPGDDVPRFEHVSSWLRPLTRWDAARFVRKAEILLEFEKGSDSSAVVNAVSIEEWEQLHAFLPLYPWLIRWVVRTWEARMPTALHWPSQTAAVWVGAVLNIAFFVGATLVLYDFTLAVGKSCMMTRTQKPQALAAVVTFLFIVNPANVFFSALYSEALAALLIFRASHSAWGMTQSRILSTDWTKALVRATLCWWAACWTRSNAVLYAGFLLLYIMGVLLSREVPTSRCVATLLIAVALGVLTLGGLTLHNRRGCHFLCHTLSPMPGVQPPAWCGKVDSTALVGFNLYGYVQDQYWNVGFLRYWQLKQIPNFILAAPILYLSTCAVGEWIWWQWMVVHCGNQRHKKVSFYNLWHWALRALPNFSSPPRDFKKLDDDKWSARKVLLSPTLLGFYAVLAVSVLLTLFVAHVQIATRLICSSCPALYWYLAYAAIEKEWGSWILVYCFLYISLGVLLHPNWLPWT